MWCAVTRRVFNSVLLCLASLYYPQLDQNVATTLPGHLPKEADIVIIGGGAAGSIAAYELSASGETVVVLERGAGETPDSRTPILWSTFDNTSFTNGLTSTKQTTTCQDTGGKCRIYQPIGLGGHSSTNDMFISRANPKDFYGWEKTIDEEWGYRHFFKEYKKLENVQIPELRSSHLRGTAGKINVGYSKLKTPITDTFLVAGKEKGLPNSDYNGKQQISLSRPQLHLDGPIRQSIATAYLQGLKRKNLFVATNVLVDKVLINDNNDATGVKYLINGVEHKIFSKKGIVLAAGPIDTAAILQRSGVGPTKLLNSLGIKIKEALPVGKNFQDQMVVTLAWTLKGYSNPKIKDQATVCNAIDLALYKNGSLTTNGVPVISYINTKQRGRHDVRPDVFMIIRESSGKSDSQVITNVVVLRPSSSGTVKIQSSKPTDPPLVNIGFNGEKKDIHTAASGLAFANSLFKTKAFKKYQPVLDKTFHPLCMDLKSDHEYIDCVVRKYIKPYGQAVGTAKLGCEEDESAVVGPRMDVLGLEKLFVIGSAVIPHPLSAPSFFTSLVTAVKGARYIAENCSVLKSNKHGKSSVKRNKTNHKRH